MKMDDLVNERREFRGASLVIFDIDDTLLHTTAKINVVRDGQVIRSLTNQEFNNYQLQPGEEFDFGEFRNAEKFAQESKPIKPMINKLKTILRHADQTQSKVIMLTARADFDDKHTVLKTFHNYGIDMSRIHLYRAGNIPGDNPPALKKAVYVRKFLSSGDYDRVSLYDDSTSNLKAFKALKKEFPHVRFSAYHVNPTGHATQVETVVNEKIGDVVQIAEPGDTVYSIARQNNLDPVELMKFNGFNNSTKLTPGQQVKLPSKSVGRPVDADRPNILPPRAPRLPNQASVSNQPPSKNTQAMQPQLITSQDYESLLRNMAIKANIVGEELAQFMAQCYVESAGYTTTEEFASGANYEGRGDLGNFNKGDGIKYKGRGFIQLTGYYNYRDASIALNLPLASKPQLVEQPTIAAKVSIWFWKTYVKQKITNFKDTESVTWIVNGGQGHIDKRIKAFQRYLSTMIKKPFKESQESQEPDLMSAFEDFLPIAMTILKLDKLPPIKLVKDVPGSQPSFGGFDQESGMIYLQITNRHPLDIFRTLAHELVHFKQDTEHKLSVDSGKTGSPIENEANAVAGIIMRHFNKKYPQYLNYRPLIKEDSNDYEIHNYEKLDKILTLLCKMVIEGQKKDKEYYGMVAACVLDPDNKMVAKVNYPIDDGKRVHAERAAMETYQAKYGKIPEGSIIITTLSPCNEISDETADGRSGNNCTDLINHSPIRKVYCGYMDPSQGDEEHEERDFNLMETENGKIRDLCKSFADTFLDINESLTPNTIHKLADRKGVKWDNEPSFLKLTKRLTGHKHLDDLDQADLQKVKHHLEKQGVAESVNDYLWHGSKSKHDILYPQQANDTGGKKESNKNAVYATPSAKVAIAMGLTTPGSDTGMFPNDPQMVLFKGSIRKGQMIYLHKVPKDLFIKHNDREWYSKPGVKEVKPLEVVTVPVDKWLHLIRQATPQDLELQKKYMKEGVTENFADGRHPEDKGDSKRHGINTKASVSSLRKTAKQGGRKGQLAHWLANMKAGRQK